MKGRAGEGSRQGHRCDTALTKAMDQCGGSVATSEAKLSPSCLVHLSIKVEHISLWIQKMRQIYCGNMGEVV